jgi:hypothetical protein
MKYTLTTPFVIGDLQHQVTIDALELASVAINFEPFYADQGTAVLSLVFVHRDTNGNVDWRTNTVYDADASALQFWLNLDTASNTVTKAVFNKMFTDGRIPAGTLA